MGVEIGPLLERQRDVLRQFHRAQERARLEEDPGRRGTLGAGGRPGADADRSAHRLLETDQVAEQGGLSRAAASEDREHLAVRNRELEVLEQRRAAPTDRQPFHVDHVPTQSPNALNRIVNSASISTMANRLVTAAEVVARPTPSAPPLAARPRWQAMRAITMPKATLFTSPEPTSHSSSADRVSRR